MAFKDYIVGIDVGTSRVITIVAQYSEEGALSIIGIGNVPSAGIKRGVVVSIEEAISSITRSLEEAERMSGYPIESAFVSVGGSHIASLNSKGVIAIARSDGEILPDDVSRVVEAAQAISLPMNREVLHVLPRSYVVDGQDGIENPIGMTGVRLEVETHVINAASSTVRNLAKCIAQTGVQIEEIVMGSLAASEAVLSIDDKRLGVVLLDIGAGTTDISIFVDGSVWHSAVVPVGSHLVTNDIAIGLRVPFAVAERIKREAYYPTEEYQEGSLFEKVHEEETDIDLEKYGFKEGGYVSRKDLNGIVEARLREIFEMVQAEIRKSGQEGLLAGGAVLVGGGSLIPGIQEIAKDSLGLPARVGKAEKLVGISENITSSEYVTPIGLLLWGVKAREHRDFVRVSPMQVWSNLFGRFRNWIKRSFFP